MTDDDVSRGPRPGPLPTGAAALAALLALPALVSSAPGLVADRLLPDALPDGPSGTVTATIDEAGPARPAAGAAQGLPPATVSLPAGESPVEVAYDVYRRWIVVPATIGGTELRLILDSGAPATVLADPSMTDRLGLTIVGRARVAGAGDGAPDTVPLAGGVRMDVGGVRVEDAIVAVGVAAEAIAGVDGIIGGPLFDNLVVEIDPGSRTVRFHDPGGWSAAGAGAEVPLVRTSGGHLVVPARVRMGDGPATDVNLAVDTGSGQALSLESDAAAGLEAPEARVRDVLIGWGSNGPLRGDVGRIRSLEIGGVSLSGVVTTFPRGDPWTRLADAGTVLHGNLGSRVLSRFRLAFDVPGGRLFLAAREGVDEPFRFSTTGIHPRPWSPESAALVVADIVPGSPAADAGLEPGDRIVAIDGRPVADHGVGEIEALLEAPPGTALELEVRRSGEPFTARIVARALI